MGFISQILEDWRCSKTDGHSRPWQDCGFWVIAAHRLGSWSHYHRNTPSGLLARLLYIPGKLLVMTVMGADIRSGAIIGKRFIVHTTQGIVIADEVTIGDDCVINTGVCIVHRANKAGLGVARIGNHVQFGVGAKVLGNIKIGDHAIIGANAVVLTDVPAYSMAVGIPAVIRPLPSSVAQAKGLSIL